MKLLERFGNQLAIFLRKRRLKNHKFSLISNNCIGGFMMHGVKEEFRSPTVNLLIHDYQFCDFCRFLQQYAECEVAEPTESEKKRFQALTYPVGILRGKKWNIPDIVLYFMHYRTFEEAKKSWERRIKRINFDNLFIVFNRDMEAKKEIIDDFETLPYEHKVFITHLKDPARWKDTVSLSCFDENYHTGDLYLRHWVGLASYYWFDEFDYVEWLNNGTIKMRPHWKHR